MKCIEEQIAACCQGADREENDIIKADLRLIDELAEKIRHPQDRKYLEKIIGTFCEIIEIQREIINEAEYADMLAAGYGPPDELASAAVPGTRAVSDAILNAERARALHPCVPPRGGFQTDEQVRKAFYNYLTYHTAKETKNGAVRPFSKHTVYDYCSRIKKLWEFFYAERQSDISAPEELPLPDKSFLNAYRQTHLLKQYLAQIGAARFEKTAAEHPLCNPKSFGNTSAALVKFEEFRAYASAEAEKTL